MSGEVNSLSTQITNLFILRNTSQSNAIKTLALALIEEAEYPEDGSSTKSVLDDFRIEVNRLIKAKGLENAK
jgi:hypothetical protein